MQVWRIVRNTTEERGEHIRFHNTDYSEGPLFRGALGLEARSNGEGFVWDKLNRYWWVSIANASRYIAGPDNEPLAEDEITEELLEEVVRNCDLDNSD